MTSGACNTDNELRDNCIYLRSSLYHRVVRYATTNVNLMALVYSHPDDDDAAEGYHEQLPLVSNAASSFQRLDTDEENEVDPQPKSLRKSFQRTRILPITSH